ncbi:MAG: alpha/beta hydrolase [Aeriscardovia sp.]|nr:alpha/beta hydrolase [Aeriscardovia sp.]
MKKLFLLFILCITTIATKGQNGDAKGEWSGQLNVFGQKLTLVFHLNDENCTLDSPDQGVKGVPAKLERTETGIKVSVSSINASYEGINKVDSITGIFKQRGVSFPLTLKPGTMKRKRPQTPVAPFPYQTQEVSFKNGDAVLKGTLVLPENHTQKTPVVLMVTGSGLQNRDEEVFEHKPFAVIADALARQGIATLRYDDRGFGESTGDLVNVTTEDLKNDALAGVKLLRKQFSKVGVLGHSEGGTIGLILAAEGKVDFVVSLAGGVISFEETLLDQNRWTLQQAGYSKDVTDRYCTVLKGLFDELKAGGNPAPANHNLPAELEQNLKMAQAQSSTPYMRYFLGLDLTGSLGKITCPVLALNGTKDRQVNCEENLNALQSGLGGQKEIKAMDGLNHMFQHCGTGNPSEYKDIEETFAPEALDIITTWLKKFK